jgi:2,3-bisphosphoglycerate-independent phosphoglycerate mutase
MDRLYAANATQLEAHGLHVGLPEGLMGNSEVGHLNIGAGRVIYQVRSASIFVCILIQDIVRIDLTCANNKIITNPAFSAACARANANGGRLHLLGLVSDGGVHSHMNHMFAMVKAAKELKVPHTFLHFFGDGRDTSPTSGG